jgi:hypothetical protein
VVHGVDGQSNTAHAVIGYPGRDRSSWGAVFSTKFVVFPRQLTIITLVCSSTSLMLRQKDNKEKMVEALLRSLPVTIHVFKILLRTSFFFWLFVVRAVIVSRGVVVLLMFIQCNHLAFLTRV